MNKSTIILLLTALLANGCIFDSGDDISENNLLTPFTLNITGDWNFELDEDTTFRYSNYIAFSFESEVKSDTAIMRKRNLITLKANNREFNNQKIFQIEFRFNGLQPKPGKYKLTNPDSVQLTDNGNVTMNVRNLRVKQSNESRTRQQFVWQPQDGFVTVTKYDNERLQGSYEFTGNLSQGRKQIFDNNGVIVEDVKYEDIKEAVFVEGRFDVDMSESDDN